MFVEVVKKVKKKKNRYHKFWKQNKTNVFEMFSLKITFWSLKILKNVFLSDNYIFKDRFKLNNFIKLFEVLSFFIPICENFISYVTFIKIFFIRLGND